MKPIIVLYMLFSVVHLLPQDGPISTKNDLDARIINGGRAVKGQFPWHANIFAYDAGTEVSKCGGSLIHPQWVLTAAHCLQIEGHPIIDLLLLFGAIEISIKNKNVKKGYSSKWFVHHRYNTTTLYSDIGLIKLNDRMKKTEYIETIKIGSPIKAGTRVILTGFGATRKKNHNTRLHYAILITIRNTECQKHMKEPLYKNQICTEVSSKENMCEGDSGGGLVRRENGEWTVVGVASFMSERNGTICNAPSGFTRISSFQKWISKVTKKHT